jgi:hypothetical protein
MTEILGEHPLPHVSHDIFIHRELVLLSLVMAPEEHGNVVARRALLGLDPLLAVLCQVWQAAFNGLAGLTRLIRWLVWMTANR